MMSSGTEVLWGLFGAVFLEGSAWSVVDARGGPVMLGSTLGVGLGIWVLDARIQFGGVGPGLGFYLALGTSLMLTYLFFRAGSLVTGETSSSPGPHDGSAEVLERQVEDEQNPEKRSVLLGHLGDRYLDMSDLQRAAGAYRQAAKLTSFEVKRAKYLLKEAKALALQGRKAEAAYLSYQARQLDPQDVNRVEREAAEAEGLS